MVVYFDNLNVLYYNLTLFWHFHHILSLWHIVFIYHLSNNMDNLVTIIGILIWEAMSGKGLLLTLYWHCTVFESALSIYFERKQCRHRQNINLLSAHDVISLHAVVKTQWPGRLITSCNRPGLSTFVIWSFSSFYGT